MNSNKYWTNRQNQNIKHAKSIENNFLAEQQKQYTNILNDINSKVANLYAKYGNKGILSRSDLYDFNRYNKLRKEIYVKCSALGKSQQSEMYSALSKVYKDTFKNIDFEDSNSIIKWNKINETTMKNSINSIRYGKDFSSRVWDNTDLLAKEVSNQIESVISGSGTISDCKKAIKEKFNSNFSNVDRLVRTESMYNLNNATLDRYKNMGITEYKIVVTEDSRTSEICNKMDGKVFNISEAEVGVNLPPLHVRCRSTIIPVMDDDLTKEKNKDKIKSGLKVNIQLFGEEKLDKQTDNNILKGIKTLEKRLSEHELKIANPSQYINDWDSKTEEQKQGLIKHWKKEIQNFKQSIQTRNQELLKRGIK